MRQHEPFLEAMRVAFVEHGLAAKDIATIAGLEEKTIAAHFRKNGLQPRLPFAPAVIRKRFAQLARDVLPKMEAAARDLTEKPGEWTKARLDAVTQLSRLLDRFGELAGYDNQQQESAKDRDERTAGALKKIDDRIVELAEKLARRLVEEQSATS